MNYAWEVLLTADAGGIDRRKLKFIPAAMPSPYAEVSFADLNTTELESVRIEVNPLYRFSDIFSEIFHPDISEYREARRIFLDVFMHYMAWADMLSGMHRQEYYFWFLLEELQKGVFGERAGEAIALFSRKEQRRIVTSMLSLYQASHDKEMFTGLVKEIYENAIVYEGRDRADAIYLYIGRKETEAERKRIRFLVDTFLPLGENVEIFYDAHFGVMDVKETMVMDKILLI